MSPAQKLKVDMTKTELHELDYNVKLTFMCNLQKVFFTLIHMLVMIHKKF